VTDILPGKLKSYGGVLKLTACVSLVGKAADKRRIYLFFKSFRVKKINELVATSNKLINFTGLVTKQLWAECGPQAANRTMPIYIKLF
jgi:hypothetical protein